MRKTGASAAPGYRCYAFVIRYLLVVYGTHEAVCVTGVRASDSSLSLQTRGLSCLCMC